MNDKSPDHITTWTDALKNGSPVAAELKRSQRLALLRLALAATLFVACGSPFINAGDLPDGPAGFESHVAPFLEAHCVRCHGPDESKGQITVHTLDGDLSMGLQLERWERILEMIADGEMPPEDEPQPEDEDRAVVARWIESGLRDYLEQTVPVNAEPTARRLTNIEYQNTLRDLLGFELHVINSLPQDPQSPYRFNNSAEFMRVGQEQIDRYLEVARRALASAIVDPGEPELHLTRREWDASGNDRGLGYDEIGVWGNRRNSAASGMGLKSFPQTGEFRIRCQASAILPQGIEEVPLRLVMGYSLGRNSGNLRVAPVGTVRLSNSPDDPQVFEFRGRIENYPAEPIPPRNGQPQPDAMSITPQNLYDDGTLNDSNDFSNTRNIAMPRVVLNWLEFEGPVTDVWPPEHHTRILFDSPMRETDPDAYAREVLRRFMSRAYRRPARDAEVERFVRIHNLIRPDFDTLEAAIRETLAMVLVSPQFLYLSKSGEPDTRQYELASKLSYFLWASMPDEQLLELAAAGRLDDPEIIEQQVQRMVGDERSRGFVENFTLQWLSIEKMRTVPINRELYPRFLYYVPRGERAGTEVPYRPTVRDYMIEETVGFVGELIRRNASVLQIVDSDFAWLNQRLAVHYGIQGVQGDELRAVSIRPEDNLGGLLTHGSVLVGNGTGTAPHPIYRAVWLREAILGDEVAPPPADVPALSDSAGESAETALTIAELLAAHRQVESCNDCHSRLDPWGIPFERYNAIGRYQATVPVEGTRVRGFNASEFEDLEGYQAYLDSINTVEVAAEARVPRGPSIKGMRELKGFLLLERQDEIAENMTRRLLTYGLGRDLTIRDRIVVAELLEDSADHDHRIRDMIVLICQSRVFRPSLGEGE